MDMLQEYVSNLSAEDRLQILKDYMDFEKTGVQGDTLLRRSAEEYAHFIKAPSDIPMVWAMTQLACGVAMYEARKALGLTNEA